MHHCALARDVLMAHFSSLTSFAPIYERPIAKQLSTGERLQDRGGELARSTLRAGLAGMDGPLARTVARSFAF